ncbi:MAG: 50S ribosomal protein L17 [Negativicutes bacterium]|nr:50S ribosomal protein L17 [Negativicutes bacterium]
MGYRKLGRNTGHRKALLRNLVTSLLEMEQIETTETRAKEVSSIAEKMITLGKRGDLHARRQAAAYLTKESVAKKVFDDVAKRCATRPGGYTRILKLGPRRGDAAPMVLLQLVDGKVEAAKKE